MLKNHYTSWIVGLLILYISSSCHAQNNTQEATDEVPGLESPSKTGLAFPVYTSFDALEPIFHYDNDTTYVINFWATWCKPCVEELPYFEKLHATMQGLKVKVILVSLDWPKQIKTKLIPFIEKHQLKSNIAVLTDTDSNNWIPKVDANWTGAIPVTMVYGPQGRQFVDTQFPEYSVLEDLVIKVKGGK